MRQIAFIASLALLLGVSAAAQESRSEVSLQGTGFFTKDSTGQGTTERSTNTGGFLVGYRYHFNRWLAAEAVYGYDRNSQHYFGSTGLSRIQANVHQATGGLVFRVPAPARFRISPYVLAEGGALVFDPTGNTFGTVLGAQHQATGVFAYGAGADFPIVKHIALRAEYRGLVYNAPDFGVARLNTNTITHTAQTLGRRCIPLLIVRTWQTGFSCLPGRYPCSLSPTLSAERSTRDIFPFVSSLPIAP